MQKVNYDTAAHYGRSVAGFKLSAAKDRVIVRPLKQAERTPGGIVLPESAKDTPQWAEVLSAYVLDDGGKEDVATIPLGAHVLFAPYSGFRLEHNGEKLVVLKADEVLAISEAE